MTHRETNPAQQHAYQATAIVDGSLVGVILSLDEPRPGYYEAADMEQL